MSLKSFSLENKVTLVTGAGRGIGRALAKGLAEAGSDLVLVSRSREQLEGVAAEVRALGKKALVLTADLRDWDSIQTMADQAVEAMGRIDVLINNAGVTVKKPTQYMTKEDWDQIIGTNLTGVFACAQAVGRHMIEKGGGRIINVGSVAGATGLAGNAAYCASKGGVLQFTKSLAVEWARYNVNVNAIGPAYIETDMVQGYFEVKPQYLEKILRRTPMERLGKPDEIVGAAVFLASDASSYVTGEIIYVDGGWMAYGI